MKCDQIQLLYSDFYEGALPANLNEQVQHHLRVCTECRTEYERFSEAMNLLDEPVAEVDAPLSFRADVLARIASQPRPEKVGLLGWLSSVWNAPNNKSVKLAGAALAAIVIVGAAAVDLSTPTGRVLPAGPGFAPPTVGPSYHGPFRSLSTSTQDGKVYHNFQFQLPAGMQSASVSAYVLQDGRPLTDDSALSDPGNATLAWQNSEPVNSSDLINIPVAVVSDVPPGSTLTFMILSRGSDGSERKDAAFVPLDDTRQPEPIERGSNLFTTLKAVAAAQDVSIVVDDSALEALASSGYSAPANVDGSSPITALFGQQTALSVVSRGAGAYAIVAQ